jgi:hypothetical protein
VSGEILKKKNELIRHPWFVPWMPAFLNQSFLVVLSRSGNRIEALAARGPMIEGPSQPWGEFFAVGY